MSKNTKTGYHALARRNAFAANPLTDLTVIGLDTDDGPEHPLFDPRVLEPPDEKTVKNIMAIGITQPIVTRKNGDRIEVVAGRRRVINAREASRRLVELGGDPVLVPLSPRKGSDLDMFGVMVAENEHRRGDTPLGKARKAQRYQNMGASVDDIAVAFGVERQTVELWLRLLDCDDKVLAAVEAGRLSASAAVSMHSLRREQQRGVLADMVASGKPLTKAYVAATVRSLNEDATEPPYIFEGDELRDGVQTRPDPRPPRPLSDRADVVVAPGRRVLKKIVALAESGDVELDPTVIKTIKVLVGAAHPRSVKGMVAAMAKASG